MSEAADPINYLLTGGGLSGGAVGGYLISRMWGGNGKGSSEDGMADQLEHILAAQQQTNMLLAELKGILASRP